MAHSKKQHSQYGVSVPAGKLMGPQLLQWYSQHHRDLPWRRTRDPYRIWVSEVMLQQTRVETVIPYYRRWLQQFPTVAHLAKASEDQVLKAWEGLGYYSRARNLHYAAQQVLRNHGGVVPATPEALRKLKGVGPYTAGAILSIAFNQPVAAVDGNVMRVLSRLFCITDDITLSATRRGMQHLAQALIPHGEARHFNQALMELGALVCTPTSPKCPDCPLANLCKSCAAGTAEDLPVKKRAQPPRPVEVVAVVVCHDDKVLIRRRPKVGLLAGLWEFPGGERIHSLSWEQSCHALVAETLGMELELESYLCDVKHVFTHLVWNLKAFTARPGPNTLLPSNASDLRWVRLEQLSEFALPTAHQKIVKCLRLHRGGGG